MADVKEGSKGHETLQKYFNNHLLRSSDASQLPTPVIFIVDEVCDVLQVHEVRPDQHIPQRDEIAMGQVLDVNHAPGILSSTRLLAIHIHDHVRTNNSKRNTLLHASVLLLVILLAVRNLGKLVDLDFRRLDLIHDGLFELLTLLRRHGVCLGQYGDYVHLVVELLHEFNVQRF